MVIQVSFVKIFFYLPEVSHCMGERTLGGNIRRITRIMVSLKWQKLNNHLSFVCLFDLIFYVPSKIFQLNRDGSSWVESVLS